MSKPVLHIADVALGVENFPEKGHSPESVNATKKARRVGRLLFVFPVASHVIRQSRRGFHDLRHTFASLLLRQGESMVYVKEQMGHSSIQVTVDLYGKLIPGRNKQAVDRLDTPVEKTTYKAESATQPQPLSIGAVVPTEFPLVN